MPARSTVYIMSKCRPLSLRPTPAQHQAAVPVNFVTEEELTLRSPPAQPLG